MSSRCWHCCQLLLLLSGQTCCRMFSFCFSLLNHVDNLRNSSWRHLFLQSWSSSRNLPVSWWTRRWFPEPIHTYLAANIRKRENFKHVANCNSIRLASFGVVLGLKTNLIYLLHTLIWRPPQPIYSTSSHPAQKWEDLSQPRLMTCSPVEGIQNFALKLIVTSLPIAPMSCSRCILPLSAPRPSAVALPRCDATLLIA